MSRKAETVDGTYYGIFNQAGRDKESNSEHLLDYIRNGTSSGSLPEAFGRTQEKIVENSRYGMPDEIDAYVRDCRRLFDY